MLPDINRLIVEAFKLTTETPRFRPLVSSPETCLGSVSGVEKENQDRVAVVEYLATDAARSFRLYVVADGVGGLTAGGNCAEHAIAAMVQSMIASRDHNLGSRLVNGFKDANKHVFSTFKGDSATTLAVLAFSGDSKATIASVGDSRIYRYTGSKGSSALNQLTEDDTIGNQVARAKGKNPTSTSPSGIRGQLTQAIGAESDVSPELVTINITTSDKFILTTDGLHSMGQETLLRVLTNAAWPIQAIQRSTQLAEWFGTKDDVSGIFVGSLPPLEADEKSSRSQGILRIHTPNETSVFSRVSTFLNPESTKPLAQVNVPPKKPKRKNNRSRKRQSRSSKKPSKQRDENSKKTSNGDPNLVQQELEIAYITSDGD